MAAGVFPGEPKALFSLQSKESRVGHRPTRAGSRRERAALSVTDSCRGSVDDAVTLSPKPDFVHNSF
jgi:hypothetical protein